MYYYLNLREMETKAQRGKLSKLYHTGGGQTVILGVTPIQSGLNHSAVVAMTRGQHMFLNLMIQFTQ